MEDILRCSWADYFDTCLTCALSTLCRFLAHDSSRSGLVHFEDLRQMCESFGMQLDDDSLLALFCVYDPEGTCRAGCQGG